ncbi:MAG: T9SS type A sorting domain-containing protein [Ignavibacteriaceae bacterium]|nr:T9SS type A sorting domain-containing protein [Ignavibacteriaceae bacterium]
MRTISTLWLIMLLVSMLSLSALAQDGPDDKAWSYYGHNPTPTGTINPEFKWDDPIPETKHYFLGGSSITVFPPNRVLPGSNSTQSELSIDVHPLDENIVFGSSNATNSPVSVLYGTGVYWSLDGSQTYPWNGTNDPGTLPGFGRNSGDPVSVIGVNGYWYEGYISNPGGQGISVTTDNGANWSTYTVAPNPGSLADKNHLMVDKTSTSPYVNRVYATWTDFGGANSNDGVVRYSTNFGQNWSGSINVTQTISAGSHSQGVNVQTAANGDVYVAFAIYDAWPGGEDAIGLAKSTDGGVTWTTSRIYSAVNFGIRGNLSSKNGIRVASFPSMAIDRSGGANDGTIYITWPQRGVAPAGSDPDIVLIKSTDGGATWLSPIRVNDDVLNNGKDQYYPWVTVDQSSGRVILVWYDSRDVPNNQAEIFMAHSTDGASTFENFKVSSQPHNPAPISGLASGYAGDYIGVAAHNNVAFPFWAENSTGNYQAWTSRVEFGAPCPVDPPTNPNPVNGAAGVPITLTQLTWTNGAGANTNETYFGTDPGSLTLVQSGTLATSWTINTSLQYNTSYYWRIIEIGDTCNQTGPIWSFTIEQDPNLVTDTIFCDPFENGLGLWTVTNNGGTCVWEVLTPPYPNAYTLPATSSGGVLAADSDECGSGTTVLTTAQITQVFDLSIYTGSVWLEFDNDWNVFDAADEAHIEISIDGGTTWTGVWDQIGTDIRNTHEVVDITTIASEEPDVRFRLRSVQPGWDWWWAVDNFCIYGMYIVPVELTSFTASVVKDGVELNWATATETNNQGFEVEKLNSEGEFENIGFIAGFGTTVEPKEYSFTDNSVSSGSYTYRLKQIDYDGKSSYSDELIVEVVLPIEYALEQNYPNPFNPSTTIKYSIPEDGFVKLAVYNMLGEEVSTLINTQQKAGRYEVTFDASELASGVYIYRLEAANYTASKKLMLMK